MECTNCHQIQSLKVGRLSWSTICKDSKPLFKLIVLHQSLPLSDCFIGRWLWPSFFAAFLENGLIIYWLVEIGELMLNIFGVSVVIEVGDGSIFNDTLSTFMFEGWLFFYRCVWMRNKDLRILYILRIILHLFRTLFLCFWFFLTLESYYFSFAG